MLNRAKEEQLNNFFLYQGRFRVWKSFDTIGHLRKIDVTSGRNVISDYGIRGYPKGVAVYDSSRQPQGMAK